MNLAILEGYVGKDPEMKYTQGNKTPICMFNLATKDYKGKGEYKTNWHRVKVFGKLAEVCEKYVFKGTHVLVRGRIDHHSYKDKTGKEIWAVYVLADEVRFLEKAGDYNPKMTKGEADDAEELGSDPTPDEAEAGPEIPF